MRKIILSLSAALLASIPVWAINCQVETDCTTLGYTIDSDAGGCLKCPFGNKWANVRSAINGLVQLRVVYPRTVLSAQY